jgi:YD repeat-containing protein
VISYWHSNCNPNVSSQFLVYKLGGAPAKKQRRNTVAIIKNKLQLFFSSRHQVLYPVIAIIFLFFNNNSIFSEGSNTQPPNPPHPLVRARDAYQGDEPVNITNGNTRSTNKDLFIPGKGLPIEFTRTYNSKSFYNNALGYGWTYNYNIFLVEKPDGTIIEKDKDGTLIDFAYENAWRNGILNKIDIMTGEVKLRKGFKLSNLPQSSNVIGFWKFEESSGIIHDETANHNDGTYNGNLYQQPGQSEHALGFDGNNDIVTAGTTGRPTNTFTFGGWIKTSTPHQIDYQRNRYTGGTYRQKYAFWAQYEGSNAGAGLSVGTNGISVYEHGAYYMPAIAVYPANIGSGWNHIIIVYKNKLPTIYLNGVAVHTGLTSPKQIVYAPYTFGGGIYGHFKGQMDEAAIWNKALTAEEVTSLYELSKYPSSGALTLKFNGGITQSWESYSFIGEEDNGTNIKLRFRSADTEAGLESASWSKYYDAASDPITDVPDGQWIETEGTLESNTTQAYTPKLNSLTVNYSGGSKIWESKFEAKNHSILTKNSNGTYIITRKNGTKYNFNTDGRLTSIQDRNNNQVTLNYTDNKLTTVTGPSGRVVILSYTNDKITQINTPGNKNITYIYDENDNLIQVTDPLGNSTNYIYDKAHNLIQVTDANDNKTYFIYDGKNRCIETKKDEDNQMLSFIYEPENSKTIMIDANGNQTTFIYDKEKGVVTSITDALGNLTTSTWDKDINRTSQTDANGHTTYLSYDDRGNMLNIKDPLNNNTKFSYEPNYNFVTGITDALSQKTQYKYDANGNLLRVIDAEDNQTYYTYDNQGQLLSLIDAKNNQTQYSYDPYGNLSQITDAENNNTSFTYDIYGNATGLTDAKKNITLYQYDANNRLTKIIYPDETEVNYTYDHVGNRLTVTDPNNRVTTYEYDVVDRLTQVIDALSNITQYDYDKMDNRLSVTDANSNITQYLYNDLNRLIKTITPTSKETSYQYDAVGNRISSTDANGNTINYIYNDNNRLIKINYPTGTDVEFTYDILGRRTTMVDSTGVTTYIYDNLNRLIQVTGPGTNNTIAYEYDEVGNRTKMINQDGGITTYEYDSLNRLIKLIDPNEKTTIYEYDEISNLIKMLYPNNTEANYTYDNLNRLTQLANGITGQPNNISSYSYDYDFSGMRTRITLKDNSYINYQYDALNRLIDETKKYSDNNTEYFNKFTYDSVGNRTKLHRSVPLEKIEDNFDEDEINEEWLIADGRWLIENNLLTIHDASSDAIMVYEKEMNNPTIEATLNVTNTGTKKVSGLIFSYTDENNFYYAGMKIHGGSGKGKGKSKNESAWIIGYYTDGEWVDIAIVKDVIIKNQVYDLKVSVNGEHVSLYSGDTLKTEADILGLTAGKVGFCLEKNFGEFDTFKVTLNNVGTLQNNSEEYGEQIIDYAYNEENQLVFSTDGISYTYDNNGNLINKIEDSKATTYAYDYENRLVTINDSLSTINYVYDGIGRRIKTIENGVIKQFLYV